MSSYTHNFGEIQPPLLGFGQHLSRLPPEVKADRISQLKRTILEAGRELEQLLAQEG